MPSAWGGADPVAQVDGNDYSLGTEYRANVDITITHVRVYAPAGETNMAGRTGKIWSTTGSLLGSVSLPDDLPTGWSQHQLPTPVERTTNQRWVVSYDTGGNYGALIDGLLAADVNSLDSAVTALRDTNATNGNGAFNTTPGAFPTTSPAAHFYGADVVYQIGLASNTAPSITNVGLQATNNVLIAQIVAEDPETLVGATYRFDWGDGTITSSASPIASHTYTASGTYALLFSVTDDGGLSDYAARFARIVVPSEEPLRPAYIFPDAEALVINYLRPRLLARPETWLTGLKVGNKKPETGSGIDLARVVYVRRIGGQPRDPSLDLARLDFKCYGRSEQEAQDIAALVYALMQASVNFSGITRVTQFLGLTNAPDDLSNAPRYLFTMEFHIKGQPLI